MDEDYESFGLSGELSAVLFEAGLSPRYARVCTQKTIPYARDQEYQTLPNVERICAKVKGLVSAVPEQIPHEETNRLYESS